jgi:hypothetical protein
MNAFLIVDGASLADPSNNFINKVRELLMKRWLDARLYRSAMRLAV